MIVFTQFPSVHILPVFSVKTVSEMVMSEQHNANVCISPWETTVASMENYESRPLYISGKAIVKTSLARCLAALKQQNWLNYNGQAFGMVKTSNVVHFQTCPCCKLLPKIPF